MRDDIDDDVAVVGFAHAPHVRRTEGTTNGVEMLMPCFAEFYDELGIKQTDIGFWCSGSSDYLAGRAFSFISAIDSIGAVPPINESHVEMDAAWALYEAYIKLLTGAGRHRAGLRVRQVVGGHPAPRARAADRPVHGGAAVPDAVSIAGLQARFGLDSGKWTAEQMAQVALDSMYAVAERTDSVEARLSYGIDELLARPYFADPLRRHDIAPITDGASAIVLAAGDKARELRENPAWITGFEHRIETPVLGARDLTTSPSTAASAQGRHGRRRRLDRGRRDLRPVHPSAADPDRGHRAERVDEGQPVRRRAGRQPDVLDRPGAHRLRGPAHLRRLGAAGAGARDQRRCAATESGRGHGRRGNEYDGRQTRRGARHRADRSTSPSARTSR